MDSALANTIGLIVLAVLQATSLFLSRRNHDKILTLGKNQEKIYELVNHPMGQAMSSLASALESIAKGSGRDEDIQAAQDARQKSDEHNAKQAIADARSLRTARGIGTERLCLVIEDDSASARLLSDIIASCGWAADVADSAEVAIGLARNREYPVTFLDMRLPGMQGWNLLGVLKKISAKSLVVIVATNRDDLNSIPEGIYFGCIFKPPTESAVRDVLQRAQL